MNSIDLRILTDNLLGVIAHRLTAQEQANFSRLLSVSLDSVYMSGEVQGMRQMKAMVFPAPPRNSQGAPAPRPRISRRVPRGD